MLWRDQRDEQGRAPIVTYPQTPKKKKKKRKFIIELSVIVWESVPGAKTCGQPIWLKLGTEVGCHEIFEKPIWLTSLTLSFRVSGGVSFFALWAQKIQPFRGHFESAIKPNW